MAPAGGAMRAESSSPAAPMAYATGSRVDRRARPEVTTSTDATRIATGALNALTLVSIPVPTRPSGGDLAGANIAVRLHMDTKLFGFGGARRGWSLNPDIGIRTLSSLLVVMAIACSSAAQPSGAGGSAGAGTGGVSGVGGGGAGVGPMRVRMHRPTPAATLRRTARRRGSPRGAATKRQRRCATTGAVVHAAVRFATATTWFIRRRAIDRMCRSITASPVSRRRKRTPRATRTRTRGRTTSLASRKVCPHPSPLPQTGEGTGALIAHRYGGTGDRSSHLAPVRRDRGPELSSRAGAAGQGTGALAPHRYGGTGDRSSHLAPVRRERGPELSSRTGTAREGTGALAPHRCGGTGDRSSHLAPVQRPFLRDLKNLSRVARLQTPFSCHVESRRRGPSLIT